jgi:hypothetical protein
MEVDIQVVVNWGKTGGVYLDRRLRSVCMWNWGRKGFCILFLCWGF